MNAEPRDPDELRAALDRLELTPYDDPTAAAEPAVRLGRLASEWGRDDLAQRARLVHADVIGRAGETAGAGAIVQQVRIWAREHGDLHVQARSERLLSAFYSRIGDMPASLEHAVRAVELLDPDALPRLRADHLMALALALGRTRSYDAARDRFQAVLRIADETDDVLLHVAALNNLAFVEYWAGQPGAAMQAARRMQASAARYGVELEASYLDTVARTQMMLGEHAEAERTLTPLVDGADGRPIPESDALAEVLLTLAECRRLLGDTGRAQASLGRAAQLCEERDLQEVMVRVLQEQAAIYAAEGRHDDAYQTHVQFHEASQALYSAERDARARTLQAVFETEEAQRSSQQFREMSLRDSLTGLYNRRYVDDRLPALVGLSREDDTPLAVAILDLDHFKRINDELSHDTGDEVLRQVAPLLQASASRHGGFAARLGGDEFLLVMPGLDVGDAVEWCELLRLRVRHHPWAPLTGEIPVTVSIGVVSSIATLATHMLAAADQRLYASKHAGRDTVTGY